MLKTPMDIHRVLSNTLFLEDVSGIIFEDKYPQEVSKLVGLRAERACGLDLCNHLLCYTVFFVDLDVMSSNSKSLCILEFNKQDFSYGASK